MRRLTPVVRGAMALLFTVVLAAARLTAQTVPPGQEGFRAATPEDLAAGQEHLPATPLVFGAYAIVWLVLVIYVLSLWRRIARAEREVAEVRTKLEARS